MIINLIACMSRNHVIGINNSIPWYIPQDLTFFKDKTFNKPVIMGKNTYLSLGKPLKNRLNIVISTTLKPSDNILTFNTLSDALKYLHELHCQSCFIIGGEKLYKEGLYFCDYIYLTKINKKFKGDTYFPKIPYNFKIIKSQILNTQKYRLNFIKYQKSNLNFLQFLINRFKYMILSHLIYK